MLRAPIGAGLLCSVVAFSTTFAIVLGGLAAVGATPNEAISGLLAVSVTMGAASIFLSWRYRMPITAAWSTPGAALLATTGAAVGGWPAAVGAFLSCGVLLTLTGLWPGLARLVQRIPAPLAQAMLAGVLLPLCITPVTALVADPLIVAPIVLTWLVLLRFAPQWAVVGAICAAVVMTAIHAPLSALGGIPVPVFTAPAFTAQALVGIALPLYLVTMASQNIPGTAVLAGFGYAVPWRPALVTTGIGSIVGAPFGGHAINLAAITAALAAGPEAGPREKRWIAGVSAGISAVVLGVIGGALAPLLLAAPPGIIGSVAGIALIATFARACAQAMDVEHLRLAAAVTFVVAASGISALGLSSAFWALGAGLVCVWATGRRSR